MTNLVESLEVSSRALLILIRGKFCSEFNQTRFVAELWSHPTSSSQQHIAWSRPMDQGLLLQLGSTHGKAIYEPLKTKCVVQSVSWIYTNRIRWLFLSHFWLLLKQVPFFEAARAVATIELTTKTKFNEVKLGQILVTLSFLLIFLNSVH